jgi:H-type lectin domain
MPVTRVLSGSIVVGYQDARWKLHLPQGDASDLNRRTFEDVVNFGASFSNTPQVVVALSLLDATPGTLGDPNVNNVRVLVKVIPDRTDKDGFRYRVETWDASKVYGVGISWIAIA